jgi:hypothetical protein
MGTDNLHHIRKESGLSRKAKKKPILPFILIVCEGEKTEPNYFQWYKDNCKQEIDIELDGQGKNTLSLVRETIEIKRKIEKEYNKIFDQVWCVFDRDSFSPQDYNNAFQLAKSKKFQVAYSNECFEIWYLLHFHFFNSSMDRVTAFQKLDKLMAEHYKIPYKKNSTKMFELLHDRQENAIKNAVKLDNYCLDKNTLPNQNPSTSVYKLVQELNKYIRN